MSASDCVRLSVHGASEDWHRAAKQCGARVCFKDREEHEQRQRARMLACLNDRRSMDENMERRRGARAVEHKHDADPKP